MLFIFVKSVKTQYEVTYFDISNLFICTIVHQY